MTSAAKLRFARKCAREFARYIVYGAFLRQVAGPLTQGELIRLQQGRLFRLHGMPTAGMHRACGIEQLARVRASTTIRAPS
jgi:hypothetical protein